MATRTERLALAETRAKQRLHAQRAQLAKVQARLHAEEEKLHRKRVYAIGMLADTHGLLAWDDMTVARLFALLGGLTDVSDPVGHLTTLLATPRVCAEVSGNGYAHAAHGVTAAQ